MQITVKLFAQYRQERFKVQQMSCDTSITVESIIEELKIDTKRYPIGVIMINGRHESKEYVLQDGDTLSLFPKVGGG